MTRTLSWTHFLGSPLETVAAHVFFVAKCTSEHLGMEVY